MELVTSLLVLALTVHTLAGPGAGGGYVDGDATLARFSAPQGIATCAAGDVFVADSGNQVIRRIRDGVVSTVAQLLVSDLAAAPDCTLYASNGALIWRITSDGIVSELAAIPAITDIVVGRDGFVYATLGSDRIARVSPLGEWTTFASVPHPMSIAVDSAGDFFVSDGSNGEIHQVSAFGVRLNTFANDGNRSSNLDLAALGGFVYWTDRDRSQIGRSTAGGLEIVATTGPLSFPAALTVAADGTLLYAEAGNHRVQALVPGGSTRTIAGIAPVGGHVDATGRDARFQWPTGVLVAPDGTLYVAESGRIRRVFADGRVTTVAVDVPSTGYMAIDAAGNLYTTEFFGHVLRKVAPDGTVTVVAGKRDEAGFVDGAAGVSRLSNPRGVAFGPDGNLYIADAGNGALRMLSPSGVLSTVDRAFGGPMNLLFDGAGNLYYVLEGTRTLIRRTPAGDKTVLADVPWHGGEPRIARAPDGTFYYVDLASSAIWRVTGGGAEEAAGRDASPGNVDGNADEARFALPRMLVFDAAGRLYVADMLNHAIRVVDFNEPGPRRRSVRHW